jgi:hypothetical protein
MPFVKHTVHSLVELVHFFLSMMYVSCLLESAGNIPLIFPLSLLLSVGCGVVQLLRVPYVTLFSFELGVCGL